MPGEYTQVPRRTLLISEPIQRKIREKSIMPETTGAVVPDVQTLEVEAKSKNNEDLENPFKGTSEYTQYGKLAVAINALGEDESLDAINATLYRNGYSAALDKAKLQKPSKIGARTRKAAADAFAFVEEDMSPEEAAAMRKVLDMIAAKSE